MSFFELTHKSTQSRSNGDSSVPDDICRLEKVSNDDDSSSSVFDTNSGMPEKLTFADLQPLTDLPLDDSSIVMQHLPSDMHSIPFSENDWCGNISIDPVTPSIFDDILIGYPITTKDNELKSLESYEPVGTSTSVYSPSRRSKRGVSSTSSILEESEEDDDQEPELKKTSRGKCQVVRFGNKEVIKNTREYHSQRLKNNEAVKKSRERAKQKQKESAKTMTKLTNENRQLNERVNHLARELQVLKSLYEGVNQQIPADTVRALEQINLR